MIDIVKLQFPFDVKEIRIYENGNIIYPTDDIENLPAGEPILCRKRGRLRRRRERVE